MWKDAVAARIHSHHKLLVSSETYGLQNISGSGTADDEGRASVEPAVPELADDVVPAFRRTSKKGTSRCLPTIPFRISAAKSFLK